PRRAGGAEGRPNRDRGRDHRTAPDQRLRRVRGGGAVRRLDVERHLIKLADGRWRRLPPVLWRAFTVLLKRQGHVVTLAQLPGHGSASKQNVMRLRCLLAGTGYEVITHRSLGVELLDLGVSRLDRAPEAAD